MAFELSLILNSFTQLVAAVTSLMFANRLRKDNPCSLRQPFNFLAIVFFGMGFLNILWYLGTIKMSLWDNILIGPLFNILILAIWFYTALLVSGHRHIYYLIPLSIVGLSFFFVVKNIPVVSDIIVAVTLIAIFFYMGFIDHHLVRWFSLTGMVYGVLLMITSVITYLIGTPYLLGFWFIPTASMFTLTYMLLQNGNICTCPIREPKSHIPVLVEVFRFGLFVVALSILLMLGTLGVHELGHSITASAFGCTHSTTFGITSAMTNVQCTDDSGLVWITLGGFFFTAIVAFAFHIAGSSFARRISWLVLAFSLIIAIDDFSKLGMPYSATVIIIIASSALIVHGLMLIISNYEKEYADYESTICASVNCMKYHRNSDDIVSDNIDIQNYLK